MHNPALKALPLNDLQCQFSVNMSFGGDLNCNITALKSGLEIQILILVHTPSTAWYLELSKGK